MKKILLAGFLSLFMCSANAHPALSNAEYTFIVGTTNASPDPVVVVKGDRVIIIYDDGKVVILDENGGMTTIPPKSK